MVFGTGGYGGAARGRAVAVVVECDGDSGKEVKLRERQDIKQWRSMLRCYELKACII